MIVPEHPGGYRSCGSRTSRSSIIWAYIMKIGEHFLKRHEGRNFQVLFIRSLNDRFMLV